MESELRRIEIYPFKNTIKLFGSKNMMKVLEGTNEEFENMLNFIQESKDSGLLDECEIEYKFTTGTVCS